MGLLSLRPLPPPPDPRALHEREEALREIQCFVDEVEYEYRPYAAVSIYSNVREMREAGLLDPRGQLPSVAVR